jgi:uncharacterized protein (TIGR02118 family)
MIKMMAAICRRPGMTHAEYLAYIQHVHGAIAREGPPGLRRYVQNHVFDGAFGTAAEPGHSQVVSRDSVTELYWDSPQDMGATFAHEHTRTQVGPDGPNFCDTKLTLSVVAEEHEQTVHSPGRATGAKVLYFLRAAKDLSLPDFFARWSRAHARALDASALAAGALRRCIHSHQLPEFNRMLGYFGGADVIHEGVSSLWFDNTSSVGAFRAYERALMQINTEADSVFYRPADSFFVYATEVPIQETPHATQVQ